MIEPTHPETTEESSTITQTVTVPMEVSVSNKEPKAVTYTGACPACGNRLDQVEAKGRGKDWSVTCTNQVVDRKTGEKGPCKHEFKLAI